MFTVDHQVTAAYVRPGLARILADATRKAGTNVRLGCTFSFLRRSYHADIRGRDHSQEIPRLHEALDAATRRTAAEVAEDRNALVDAIDDWAGVLASA